MTTKPARSLRELCLQANPAYELVLFDRLSTPERLALEALGRDPDGYGILRPREDARLSIKSVSRETALLWFTLPDSRTFAGLCDPKLGGAM